MLEHPATIFLSLGRLPFDQGSESDSIARLDRVGELVKSGFALRPAMPGTWRWESETRLVFEPSEDWPAGEEYTLRFDESFRYSSSC